MDNSEKPLTPKDFATRLHNAQAREAVKTGRGPREVGSAGMGLGFRIVVELVAGTAVGSFFGYCLDRWIGTKPWLMVVFCFLGAAAGVMNSYRAAKGLDDAVGLGAAERRQAKRNSAKKDGAVDNE